MIGIRDGSETPDSRFILTKHVSAVSLLAVIAAGFASSFGFAADTAVDSAEHFKPDLAASPVFQSQTQSNLDRWSASPRVVAQVSSDDHKTIRERYDQTLAQIDALLAAWEKRRSIVPGFDQSLAFVLETRGKSVDAYFDADYAGAVRLVEQALEKANHVLTQEQEYYDLNMNIAMEAFEAESVTRASEAIELAMALRPDSEEAKLWQQRIAQLPDLVAARQEAIAARNTGRLQDEINALNRVLNYATNDSQALERIGQVKRILRDRNFNQTIGQGHRAVAQKDLKKAVQALTKAQQIKPANPEIKRLDQAISELSMQLKIAQIVAAARHSAEQDDWYAVQQNFEQALKLQPQANDVIEGYNFARKMVVTQRSLDDFLSRPQRLNSPNIAQAAEDEIKQANSLLAYSPRMRTTVEDLQVEIQQWQVKMPVRVLSDGETHIEVRGYGVVGKVTDKTVHLRPGNYKFEGKRKGFRNKLVDVQVAKDPNEMTTVTIICDEPT